MHNSFFTERRLICKKPLGREALKGADRIKAVTPRGVGAERGRVKSRFTKVNKRLEGKARTFERKKNLSILKQTKNLRLQVKFTKKTLERLKKQTKEKRQQIIKALLRKPMQELLGKVVKYNVAPKKSRENPMNMAIEVKSQYLTATVSASTNLNKQGKPSIDSSALQVDLNKNMPVKASFKLGQNKQGLVAGIDLSKSISFMKSGRLDLSVSFSPGKVGSGIKIVIGEPKKPKLTKKQNEKAESPDETTKESEEKPYSTHAVSLGASLAQPDSGGQVRTYTAGYNYTFLKKDGVQGALAVTGMLTRTKGEKNPAFAVTAGVKLVF